MAYDPENGMADARADAPLETGKEHEATETTVKESTLVYDNSPDSSRRGSYRPTKLQSNLTIVSCVSRTLLAETHRAIADDSFSTSPISAMDSKTVLPIRPMSSSKSY